MANYESRRYNTPVADVTKVADGSVDNTEFQYINSLSSNAQTQIAARLPLAGGTMTGNVAHGDNVKATFGASDDLEIYHDGSNSVIEDAGTGRLDVRATNLIFNNATNNKTYINCTDGAAVELSHNGTKKFETSATGVTVTGAMAATTVTGDGSALTALNASNLSSGTVPAARLPGGLGKVLQVVSTNSTTYFTSSSSSLTDITGMSVAITPSATNSKILVMVDFSADSFGDNTNYGFQLIRDSTAIGNGVSGNVVAHFNANEFDTMAVTYLDSPSTTSATTYKLQFKSFNGGAISFNRSQSSSTYQTASNITVIEIGA